MQLRAFVRSVRHPSYTGRSRSPSVTVANVVLVGLVGLGVESVLPLAGVVLVLVGLVAVAVRGYALPGMPALVRGSARLLERVGTDPSIAVPTFDPTAELRRAGVLFEVDGELRTTAEFDATWRERVLALSTHPTDGDRLATALETDGPPVDVVWRHGLLVGFVGDRPVSRWLSRAAFVADAAAITELRRRHPRWTALPPAVRGAVLNTLRLHLDVCPTCDGDVAVDRAPSRVSVDGKDVVTATCRACDARLFESDFESPLVLVDGRGSPPSLVEG